MPFSTQPDHSAVSFVNGNGQPGDGKRMGVDFPAVGPGRNLRVPASTANSELHRTTHKHTASKPIAMNFPTLDGRKDTLRFIFRERFRCAEYCFLYLLLLFRAILPNPPTKLSSPRPLASPPPHQATFTPRIRGVDRILSHFGGGQPSVDLNVAC